MKCPICGAASRIRHGRRLKEECQTKRRRECTECEHRWTTYQSGNGPEVMADCVAEPTTKEADAPEETAFISRPIPLHEPTQEDGPRYIQWMW